YLLPATLSLLQGNKVMAQGITRPDTNSLLNETGILITIILLLIPILAGLILVIVKVINALNNAKNQHNLEEAEKLAAYLQSLPEEEVNTELKKRKAALDYQLTHRELSGTQAVEDAKGLLQINNQATLPIVALKK